jgi:hypothetical protein
MTRDCQWMGYVYVVATMPTGRLRWWHGCGAVCPGPVHDPVAAHDIVNNPRPKMAQILRASPARASGKLTRARTWPMRQISP